MFLCRSCQIHRASVASKNSNVRHGIKLSQFVSACTAGAPAARSNGIFGESRRARRQLHPRVSAAVIDRHPWRWKVGVGKRTHGDADSLTVAVFGVEDGGATNRAEPESETGALIA